MADFAFERSLLDKGYRFIAGIDEVGRGALCGPVIAAAVILPTDWIAGPSARLGRRDPGLEDALAE